MGGSIGAVYYDVLPDLSKFAAMATAGLSNQKPVKVKVEADTKRAQADVDRLVGANSKLDASSRRVADAQGRLRTAQARLTDAQLKGAAGSARVVAAEESVAKASRGVAAARERNAADAVRSSARVEAAQSKVAAAAERSSARAEAAQSKVAAAAERSSARQARAAASAERAQNRASIARAQSLSREVAATERAEAKAIAASDRAARRSSSENLAARRQLSTTALYAGAGLALGVGAAVKITADFEKAVSGVAATGDEARGSIGRLRAEAIKYGADTAYSATEAANAQTELIKAGVSVESTINGGLAGALDLAAAGQLGVADAAGIMATAMSQFKLPGSDATHVADLLAAAAGKAQGEVTDMAEAFKYVGPIAKASGVSIEETTGAVAQLAEAGILGSQAGTSLRGILVSLTAPVGAGAAEMKKYGINVRDANGEFIGFAGAAQELQNKLGGLPRAERDAALARIAGKNSLTAMTVLYEGGAEAANKWTAAVDDSGYASRTAATQLDNLMGDLEKLGGAFSSAAIGSASGSQGPLRDLVQGLTSVVDKYNELPGAGQSAVLATGAVGAGLLLVGGLASKAVIGLAETTAALTAMGPAGAKAAVGLRATALAGATLGVVAVTIGAVTAAVSHFSTKAPELAVVTAELDKIAVAGGKLKPGALEASLPSGNFFDRVTGAISGTNGGLTDLGEILAVTAGGKGFGGALTSYKRFAESILPGTQTLERYDAQLSNIDQSLAGMVADGNADKAARTVQSLADAAGIPVEDLKGRLGSYSAALKATGSAAASTKGNIGGVTDGVEDQAAAAAEAAAQLYEYANALLNSSNAQLGLEAAIDSGDEALKANGKTLDETTEKGRANRTALNNLAAAAINSANGLLSTGASQRAINTEIGTGRGKFISLAKSMGASASEANYLAEQLFKVPTQTEVKFASAGGKLTEKQAADINLRLKEIPAETRADVITTAETEGAEAAKRAIENVKDKTVIARSKGDLAGSKAVDAAMKALRDRLVNARSRGDTSGANAVAAAIRSLSDRTVNIKTVYTRVERTVVESAPVGRATGGEVPRRAGGGEIFGPGTPTSDSIMGVNERGVPAVRVSTREFITNAAQYARNKSAVQTINRGGSWDVVPRRAGGGEVPSASSSSGGGTATATKARPIHVHLDLGLGDGVRTIVLEEIASSGEYEASMSRMGSY